jgi:osmotically-inducible protein OsmY
LAAATVKVSVEDGKVILRGNVKWAFQREAAASAIRYLRGVKEVINHLKVQIRPLPQDVKDKIEKALVRTATDDARHIEVCVDGEKVILTGKVHSYHEIEDARKAAWSVPGVGAVETSILMY